MVEGTSPLLVALSSTCRCDPSFSQIIDNLEVQDPRFVQTISVIRLFEQLQERLPPSLLVDSAWTYYEMPWAAPFSVQVQLKRLADLLVSAVLLLITAPFIVFAGILIWLEDQGPVLQPVAQRLVGSSVQVLKLRTMRQQPQAGQALWTQPGDRRITVVGKWLRRLRLDELPQLLNVLNGDMSLIGPRQRGQSLSMFGVAYPPLP